MSDFVVDRRGLLALALAQTAATGLAAGRVEAQAPAAPDGLMFTAPAPFSFDALKARAREIGAQPYVPPPRPAPEIVNRIDYATHGGLRFKPELALFGRGPGQFPVTFFHLGQYFQKSVRIFAVEGGQAREVVYRPDYFDMPIGSIARRLPQDAGFAGFRFQESRNGHPSRGGRDGGKLDWRTNDWAAFLGASYFRAIGDDYQYGLSARGLAIDPGLPGIPEEFPDFTQFYIEAPAHDAPTVVVYALLESWGATGAYRFAMTRGTDVVMAVDCQLHVRHDISRFCIAPITSMYWYSETNKGATSDWRPEVHDSDGLAIWTGTGERIWRQLNNPPRPITSSFVDDNPMGFGLMQRDRDFAHYQDGVAYERRPSLWVEPVGRWGRGAVQLIELPTDDEVHDNIVAAWVPAEPVTAGRTFDLAYKLHWRGGEPAAVTERTNLAHAIATRLGMGGEPGQSTQRAGRKFVVEFLGPPLAALPPGVKPQAIVTASRGEIVNPFVEPLPNDVAGHWRAVFDLKVAPGDPVELRLFLRAGAQVLTETWAYQYQAP